MDLSAHSSLLLAEFIKRNYSGRIVEVGCGKRSRVAFILSRSLDVTATDILENETVDECIVPLYTKDDILAPDLKLYQNSQLLYSIRPPVEIQHGILHTARTVQADVLIKPLDDEIVEPLQAFLRNYRGIAFYHYRTGVILQHRVK